MSNTESAASQDMKNALYEQELYNPAWWQKKTSSFYGEMQIMSQTQASDKQVGGDHYKSLAIQPAEYAYKNKLRSLEGTVVKYITRWRDKGGFEDLEKAKHCIDLIMQYEEEMRPDHKGVDA